MRDYQYKKIKEYILPEAVYRQALWAARDMGRLMEKLAEARDRLGETVPSIWDISITVDYQGQIRHMAKPGR